MKHLRERILEKSPSSPQIPVLRELGLYSTEWDRTAISKLTKQQLQLILSILPNEKSIKLSRKARAHRTTR
jgi:hypothetical protein